MAQHLVQQVADGGGGQEVNAARSGGGGCVCGGGISAACNGGHTRGFAGRGPAYGGAGVHNGVQWVLNVKGKVVEARVRVWGARRACGARRGLNSAAL